MYDLPMKVVISNSGVVTKPFLERIQLIQEDICAQNCDAITTIIPQNLAFGGRLNAQIAQFCGYDLDAFIINNVYKPKVGEVYALPGGELPVKHILLGVMPHFRTEFDMNEAYLSNVVRNMMDLARCMLLTDIAFPALCAGKGGYPKAKAARLVVQGITDRMQESFETIRVVVDDPETSRIFSDKLSVIGWQPSS